jgi:hypothetical protein
MPKAAINKNQYIPKDETIEVYLKKYEIGRREFNEMQKFAPDALNTELQAIEKSIQVY